MVRHGEAAAAGWGDGQAVDVVDEMMRLTLAIVGRTLFEVDVALETTWVGHAFGIANSHAAVESARMVPLPMRLPIARLEGKAKMSQNRPAADRAGVAAGLAASLSEADRAVARMIPKG